MRVEDGVVYFQTALEMFIKEKSGRKNNTIQMLTEKEHNMTLWVEMNEIEMKDAESEEIIRRRLTDITRVGIVAGHHLVVFSWAHQGGLLKK